MTETNRIGDGKFATPLELLPGERVLWTGGAAPRAVLVHLGRWLLLAILPLLFLVMMFLPAAMRDDNDDSSAAPARQESSSETRPACERPCGPTAERPAQKPRTAEQIARAERFQQNAMVAFYLFIALVVLFAASRIANCWLRVRNAWYVVTSERVCIHSGGWSKTLTVIDLDKIVSVQAEATWFEARMGLQSIELTHAGAARQVLYAYQMWQPNPYTIAHVPAKEALLSELVNHWLPRDDRKPKG